MLVVAVAILGATVVDGTGAPSRAASVVIRGERIESVGGQIPKDARVIDARGMTLTPGLFDLHTHLAYSGVGGQPGDWTRALREYLNRGVTTVADFGAYPETFEPVRRLMREGWIDGPRIHLAARITTPGGHGSEGGRGDFHSLEVSTPEEARAAARRWLAYNPDAIKVFTDGWRYGAAPGMTSMNEPALAAIVKEAHAQGVEVLTHTVTLDGAKIAARAGVDVIAHGVGNTAVDDELIALMNRNGTTYVSTLAVYEPRRGERWRHLLANFAALHKAGVPIGIGTDAGVTGTPHGSSTLRELKLSVDAGLTPLEALTAATGASARGIHVDRDRGTIEPGRLADLVLFDGAPHRNIADIEKVSRVFLGGREIPRAEPKAIPPRKAVDLIDDMEGERSSLDTLRVNATDPGTDHSKMTMGRILRAERDHAWSVHARMSYKPRPYAQVWFPLSRGGIEPVDATGFRGVQFDARGDGSYRLLLQRRVGPGSSAPFEAGPDWHTVKIVFPGEARDLTVLAFEIARKPGDFGWLELDNLRFY
jgi:imidazolonepropionase-like amidohydrolase